MPNSILEEIERGWKLIDKGRLEEVLNLLHGIEKKEDLTEEMNIEHQNLKGIIYFFFSQFEEALEIAEKSIMESKKLKNPYLQIQAHFLKFSVKFALPHLRNLTEMWSEFDSCEKLLLASSDLTSLEILKGKISLSYFRSWFYWNFGDLDHALDFLNKCLKLTLKSKIYRYLFFNIYLLFGHIYEEKGELEKALNSLRKCLDNYIIEAKITEGLKASALNKFGAIFYQQGKLDLASDYYKESLELLEHNTIPVMNVEACWAYAALVKIYLDMNLVELANATLQKFSLYNKSHKVGSLLGGWYKLSEARILESSTRIRDKAKAEEFFIEIIKEFKFTDIRLFTQATIEICDFYLDELRSNNDLRILDEIQPFIKSLLKESERTNSYSLQSRTGLLQGKLSLIQMNMGEARKYLTQAQQIADKHGYQLLAREISKEHDKLLEYLGKLEGKDTSEVSLLERLDMASLHEIINILQKKQALNPPELLDETPILLLIMDNSGVTYFSHTFIPNWDYTDLFSSFMSAFNTFMDEIFSKSIDRIRVGENTILINPVESFLACYVIKGQSYPALQKLSRFTEAIRKDSEIWQALNKSVRTSEMLELNKPPALKTVIDEIFL